MYDLVDFGWLSLHALNIHVYFVVELQTYVNIFVPMSIHLAEFMNLAYKSQPIGSLQTYKSFSRCYVSMITNYDVLIHTLVSIPDPKSIIFIY